jgi:tripartite-type tricarboxylate transporter receptor subunit TctC
VADLVRYAKANPAKLNYGSGGNGSAGHLAGELFKKEAGIFALHIPYNGGNPAQLALISGQVDFNFDNLATAAPNIRSGKLKAIAVTTLQRSSALPEVPPVADTLKGFSIDTWWGLVAPAGTPPDVVVKLNQAFVAALNAPETKTRFASLLAEPVGNSPEQFGSFMKSELVEVREGRESDRRKGRLKRTFRLSPSKPCGASTRSGGERIFLRKRGRPVKSRGPPVIRRGTRRARAGRAAVPWRRRPS